MKNILTIALAIFLLFAVAAPVAADEGNNEAHQRQEASQEVVTECTTEQYGNSHCKTEVKQSLEQEQWVYTRSGRKIKKHVTADTALDGYGLMAAGSIITAGLAGASYQIRKRK